MSKRLVESILSGNMLEANDVFEAKLAKIRERKMYEMKRMYATKLDEMGPFNYKQRYAELKAKGAKRASDVWGDEAKAKSGAKDAETPQRRKRPPSPKMPGLKPKGEKGSIGKWIAKKGERISGAMDKYAAEHPPGSGTVSVAKSVGKTVGRGIKNVAAELSNIGFSNLE